MLGINPISDIIKILPLLFVVDILRNMLKNGFVVVLNYHQCYIIPVQSYMKRNAARTFKLLEATHDSLAFVTNSQKIQEHVYLARDQ